MTPKQRLSNRLKRYYPLEKLHALVTLPFFIIPANYSYPVKEAIFITYGLLVCTFILYQGQRYWGYKINTIAKSVG